MEIGTTYSNKHFF